MIPVNVRVPEDMVKFIDKEITHGRFSSRSEAIKMMVAQYEEREKTRAFFALLQSRSKEAREHPESLVPLK